VGDAPIPAAIDRQMHRAIKKVAEDIQGLRFNTAIAELIKLNNEITGMPSVPRELAENLTLMLAPFAPHLAEELWERLGHAGSVFDAGWPTFDAALATEDTIELVVQVNGKVRGKISASRDITQEDALATAHADAAVAKFITGTPKKVIFVPGRLLNIVV
jgi:leucyl-tRNA synthetase